MGGLWHFWLLSPIYENIKVPPVASSSQHRLGSGVHRNGDEGTGEDKSEEAEDLHCQGQEAGGWRPGGDLGPGISLIYRLVTGTGD